MEGTYGLKKSGPAFSSGDSPHSPLNMNMSATFMYKTVLPSPLWQPPREGGREEGGRNHKHYESQNPINNPDKE